MRIRALPLGLTSLILCGTSVLAQMNVSWVRTYHSAAAELAAAMTLSPAGAITVAGNSNADYTFTGVVSYDSAGNELWHHLYAGAGGPGSSQFLKAMACDTAGNVYVTGTNADLTWSRVATVAYRPNGVLKWEKIDSSTSLTNPEAVAVSPDGSVYVVGEMLSPPFNGDDWMIIKYDSTGDTVWTRSHTSLDDRSDRAYAVVLDSAGNAYVGGFLAGGNGPEDWNVGVRKYSPDGQVMWNREWAGADSTKEVPVRMVYDASGYIYVVAMRAEGSSRVRNLILKYDLDGALQWAKEFGDYVHFNYIPEGGVLGPSGGLYFFGRRSPAGSVTYLYRLSADGDSLWARETHITGYSLLVDSGGAVTLVGQGTGASTGGGASMQRWTVDGDSVWAMRYVDPSGGYTTGRAAVMDGAGNIFMSGSLQDTVTWDVDFLTIKFVQVPTDVAGGGGSSLPSRFMLAQNYPNPFNPETRIDFTLPRGALVQLEILNLLGQGVRVLVDQRLSPGRHTYSWDGISSEGRRVASGMYFYRLQAEGFADTKKMILLK